MAKATAKTKVVEKIVKETINDGVTLELSQLEAQFLRDLLGYCVGGTGYMREISNKIYDSLYPHTKFNYIYNYNWGKVGSVFVDRVDISYIKDHEVQ